MKQKKEGVTPESLVYAILYGLIQVSKPFRIANDCFATATLGLVINSATTFPGRKSQR